MARVEPGFPASAHGSSNDGREPEPARDALLYNLVPSHALPDLDLSISIKSRILSVRALQAFDRLHKRYQKLILAMHLLGTVAYPAFLVLDKPASQYAGALVAILGLPAGIVGPSFLRYHVVRVLAAGTFEVWLFTFINTITFVVCGMALGDIRCAALIPPWLGVELNIFVDANIRAVRRVMLLTILAAVLLTLSIAIVAMGWVHGVRNVVLWEYNTHQIPAFVVILNGITTLVALLVRNVVRSRSMLKNQSSGGETGISHQAIVNCVTYRCTLRFAQHSGEETLRPSSNGDVPETRRAPHQQQMRYVSEFGVIDPCATVVSYQVLQAIHRALNAKRLLWHLSRISILLALAASPLDYSVRKSRGQHEQLTPWIHLLACVSVAIFCGFSAAHYQRQLVRAILTSFDFWFLAAQLLVVHLALCDFFLWDARTVLMVFVSWSWNVWVLCIDALTPDAREVLGVSIHMVAHVMGICIGSSVLVMYLMIFSEYSTLIHDRVLYHRKLLNFEFEFRVSPTFYSCFVTILASYIKLFWRVCTWGANDLVVIDGPVMYVNYLRLNAKRQSIPWVRSRQVRGPTIKNVHASASG